MEEVTQCSYFRVMKRRQRSCETSRQSLHMQAVLKSEMVATQALLSVGHFLLFKGYQSHKAGGREEEEGGVVQQIRYVTKDKQPQQTTSLPRQGVCPNHS